MENNEHFSREYALNRNTINLFGVVGMYKSAFGKCINYSAIQQN